VAPLRHGLCAGEPLAPALHTAWQEATGLVLYEALGMSEISTYVSGAPNLPVKIGSPGKPQDGRCVAILPFDGDGSETCAAGERGLIAVHRSDPGLMLGYWNRPQDEAEARRGDWFCGGDVGCMDEDGYVWFHGRNDDVMNAFGYRVSPVEVEMALADHPSVGEVAVAEMRVRDGVTIIAAFVVPATGVASLDEESVLAHASRRLADYKMPRAVHTVDALPRSANGKVMRRQLRPQPQRRAG
jgi:acyl-coenzyme A synthetase/AMP-(fatty) acid ligase